MKAILILEDGSCFEGSSLGAPAERMGKVALHTAVVGYQEIMTDPANAGKILVLTYPLIGNYGIAAKFNESKRCWIAGLVIKEASRIYSNWQAEGSFDEFLKKEDVATIADVDTRTLAVTIRDKGEMLAMISTKNSKKEELLKQLKDHKKSRANNFIKEISVKRPTEFKVRSSGPNIAVIDLGMLNSFVRQLNTLGCNVTLLPYDISAEHILSAKFDGLIISNGPEDDAAIPGIVKTVKNIIGSLPVLGISTGHEIIALSLGASVKRMKVGHRGVNYPVKGANSYKGEITVQNHSFVVDDASLKNKKDITITLRNINDNSIEGMESRNLKFLSVQYYPSSPGFNEVNETFSAFLKMIGSRKSAKRRHAQTAYKEVQYAKA